MTSRTALANMALDYIGAPRALSDVDTDQSVEAQAVRRHYDITWKRILESAPWNVATARASIPALASAPAHGWVFAYALPPDCLKLRDVPFATDESQWAVETTGVGAVRQKIIVTDIGAPLEIVYTRLIEDAAGCDSLFLDAFVTALASAIAMPITRDQAILRDMEVKHAEAMTKARRGDAVESAQSQFGPGTWTVNR